MPPTFDDLRTRLPEVNIFWEGGSVEYVRDVPRGWGTAGPRWSIGFVLNTVEAHEGWVDRPLFTRMPLRPGMGWLIPPWTGAYARWHEPCDYVHIELDQSLFADLSVRPEVVRPGLQVVDDTVVALGLALLMSPAADDPLYGEAVSHALARHLARRHAGAQRTPTFWGRGELRAAFDYVEANLGEPLSLQRIAVAAGRNSRDIRRMFVEATGLTPRAYVLERRLARAQHLLRHTRLPITEVAARSGFKSASYLTERLRLNRGVTPGELRRLQKALNDPDASQRA